jgi:hypothetical protein
MHKRRKRLERLMARSHREFNELVNMTPDELKTWLSGSASQESGRSKDDGSGESIGHEVSFFRAPFSRVSSQKEGFQQ